MRQRIWIQLIITLFLICVLVTTIFAYLCVFFATIFANPLEISWAILILGLLFGFVFSLGLVLHSMVIPNRDNIALNRRGHYDDLGPGSISLGLMEFFATPIIYNPRPRDLRQMVTLPTRDGTVLTGQVSMTWQPNRRQIGVFLEQEPETRLPDLLTGHLQRWSKQILPGEVYFRTPPPPVIPGLVVTFLTLTDIAQGEGGMNRYIRDNTQLLHSIVGEIQDENRIEIKRAELKRDYPDRAQRIDQLIEQRTAELRRRGLRENR